MKNQDEAVLTDYQKLCKAIYKYKNSQDLNSVAELIKIAATAKELNNLDMFGKSPIYLAVEKQNPAIIKLLLDNEADLNSVVTNQEVQEVNNTPKKLINITDPTLLFLSKIKVLSDDADTITETQLDQQVSQMRERSITPDTHKSRTMITDTKKLNEFNSSDIKPINIKVTADSPVEEEKAEDNANENSKEIITSKDIESNLDNLYYVDEYQYKNSQESYVLHFGIDKSHKVIKDEFEKLRDSEKKSVSLKSSLVGTGLLAEAKKIPLTKCEGFLVEEALVYLDKSGDKCILIDVLDRKNNDTHTVILVKQDDNTLLIDPSNPEFSFFLKGYQESLIICTDKKKTIYTQVNNTDTGPSTDQSRDCVDIAVKLAFAIKASNEKLIITEDKIEAKSIGLYSAIENITNSVNVSGLFPKEVEKNVFRVKQSSNIIESKKASVLLKVFERANSLFEATEQNKKSEQQYNKLNLEYKKEIKTAIQDLTESFISDTNFAPGSYLLQINGYRHELVNLLTKDAELQLLGQDLVKEFSYIDDYYK